MSQEDDKQLSGETEEKLQLGEEEDNNPFSHTLGLASIMSKDDGDEEEEEDNSDKGKTTGQENIDTNKNVKSLVGIEGDEGDKSEDVVASGEDSLLLYDSNSNGNAVANTTDKDSKDKDTTDATESNYSSSTTKDVTAGSVQINHESRVSQLLKPKSSVKVQINEANNSSEGMLNSLKKYIVYTIKLINLDNNNKEEIHIRRRYSDFESLRETLTKTFPLIIIPPIPPKNYFNFSMLNTLVGTKTNANNNSNSNNGSKDNSNGINNLAANDYAYINSTHLNTNKLVEHRKRLLTNFLNNCLNIPQIRNLEFFAKFLDPNANWADEINLITSQLPKDIYHLNPENGLKTSQIYSHLPSPTGNHSLSFLKPLQNNSKKLGKKTGKFLNGTSIASSSASTTTSSGNNNNNGGTSDSLNTTRSDNNTIEDDMLEHGVTSSSESSPHNKNDRDRIKSLNTSNLDNINKKIMDNFIGIANDYTELGTAFNSFSLMLADSPIIRASKAKDTSDSDDGAKLNITLDKMGQVFDRSYITINSLINDLETKFSEPLGEAVQYTEILNFIQKFHNRKIRQKKLLDNDIVDKKKTLKELLKAENESHKIENGINSDTVSKNSNYQLNNNEDISNTVNQTSSNGFRMFPNMHSFKKITKYVSDIIDQNPELTRKQKISELQSKITILEKCQTIMLEDISYIADELNKNFDQFQHKQLRLIYDILLCYNGFLINWAKKNVDIWEEIKEEILKL